MSLYLQQLRGLSALATGMVFVPMMLVGAVLTPFSALFAERVGGPGARRATARQQLVEGARPRDA